jgi:predicted RNase H-like nuclease (RuvC/YqgF family)
MISTTCQAETVATARHENSAVLKLEMGIDADRENIIQESKEIKQSRKKLKEAQKLTDKTAAEKLIQDITQDIKRRESVIRDLKKDINNKKNQRHDLLYGKGWAIPKRDSKD